MAGTPLKDVCDLVEGGVTSFRETASSLLRLVKTSDGVGWQLLVELNTPLVQVWARRAGLQAEDATDVVQESFQAVHCHIGDFRRDRAGDSFRKWLKTITNNKIRDLWRRSEKSAVAEGGSGARMWLEQVAQVPSPTPSNEIDCDADGEVGLLYRQALAMVREEFQAATWQAFWQVVVDGRAADDVAADLAISRNAVYIAKSRVLSRLRAEFSEVIDDVGTTKSERCQGGR